MSTELSQLIMNYPTSGIRKMFDLGAQYPGFINLCNGEPDFITPKHICEAATRGLELGMTKYAPEGGLPAFREAAAKKYTAQYGFAVEPRQIVASAGGVEGVMISLMSVLNAGDEVIIPDPSYTCYAGQVQLLGGRVVRLALDEANNFVPTPQQLEAVITPKTKAIILNYPNNPTGAIISLEQAEALVPILQKHDIWIITDEVYEKIVFDGYEPVSFARFDELEERVIVTNSLSKTYAMTGWRLGYVFSRNTDLMLRMPKMHQPLTACLPGFLQFAAAEAINGPQDCVDEMVAQYTIRRALMWEKLQDMKGLRPVKNGGTFCFYINVEETGCSSDIIAEKLLKEAGVLTTPGTAFGENGGAYLRLSFANSVENISDGMERMKRFFEKM